MRTRRASTGADTPTVPGPTARRLQPPSWRDARLVVGVLLVLGSIVLGSRLVAVAQDTRSLLVATRDLSPGEVLASSDLRPVEVRLGALEADYVPAGDLPAGRDHVVTPLRAGELVPVAALGTRDQVGQRQVSMPVPAGSAGPLVRGTAVEVWVSKRTSTAGTDTYGTPRRLVASAAVARDPEESTSLTGGGSTVTVQLWVPTAVVPDLLAAVDARDRLTAVPLPGAVLRSAG